ncbi:hypothetical protein BVRB_7g179670 [Beta vulgaris subsp. vulgaris]|uniref:Uncharacterized protein n=1 Tax=Beta vulgaris subsp. vulgaris TaxID=3555 RepID=A0A0J8E1P9_BETVV|nr:hypothetical protein BVRB_7g179670 [Beta vulgaris subsp. vulgaris]
MKTDFFIFISLILLRLIQSTRTKILNTSLSSLLLRLIHNTHKPRSSTQKKIQL